MGLCIVYIFSFVATAVLNYARKSIYTIKVLSSMMFLLFRLHTHFNNRRVGSGSGNSSMDKKKSEDTADASAKK